MWEVDKRAYRIENTKIQEVTKRSLHNIINKNSRTEDKPEKEDLSGNFLIYASNESKSVPARDLGDCRDNQN